VEGEVPVRYIGRLSRGGRVLVALVIAGAGFGITTAVQASIPDASGVIHGCYSKTNGTLRVIDTATEHQCRPSESALNWSQSGPAGPTGARGPSDAWYAQGNTTTTGAAVTIASVTLPAGNFTLHGSATFGFSTAAAGNVDVRCSFRGFTDGNSDGFGASDSASYVRENIAVDNDISLPSGGTVNWQCNSLPFGHSIVVVGHMVAIQVATLHGVTP
jgi:hypothetical protein